MRPRDYAGDRLREAGQRARAKRMADNERGRETLLALGFLFLLYFILPLISGR